MNNITRKLLAMIAGWDGKLDGAFNIRENGECAGRRSSEHIQIASKTNGKPGLVINISAQTRGETVYIPACVTHGDVDDLVYNDFYIGAGADVTIVAGCGVHNDSHKEARHNGIHRFFIENGAHVLYREKHIGTGTGDGLRRIDPVTDATLAEDATLEMDTLQISGVDSTTRKTRATLAARARLIIHERILTDHAETASTDFQVAMNGTDSAVELVSRSVARGHSTQSYHSQMSGNARCTGHSECDAILADHGQVTAAPELSATHLDATLIHEAAIGKIAGEQITKLRTLGLNEKQAEQKIIEGFLRG